VEKSGTHAAASGLERPPPSGHRSGACPVIRVLAIIVFVTLPSECVECLPSHVTSRGSDADFVASCRDDLVNYVKEGQNK
jgi:hypothetical protein